MKITLTKTEKHYCLNSDFLPDNYISAISSAIQEEDLYVVTVLEEEADEIRDFCSEKLQLVGFDKDYSPTIEGRILESLIDKFFID
jgi:hypothetical protein